mmetsp:Transcript_6011/g.12890  ORF Transcript_6011/g.12890 Transcript_6011/m.12890 type:complete len:1360 (-) Transcript_6011:38-4117(-)
MTPQQVERKDEARVSTVSADDPPTTLQSDSGNVIDRPPNAYSRASCFSRMFFQWPYELMSVGMKRPIVESDLPEVDPAEESGNNLKMIERMWENEKRRVAQINARNPNKKGPVRPSLHRAIFLDFLRSQWLAQFLMFFATVSKVVQSVSFGLLIDTFGDESLSQDGYLWASLIVVCGLVQLFEHHHVFFMTWRKGMQLRIACVAAIYSKSLRLRSAGGADKASSGKVMNLASNDVERFLLAALFISYGFWAPVQSIAILIVGTYLVGTAFAIGFALLVLGFVPMQVYLSRRFAFLRSKVAAITDERVTLVSQAVGGARVMKMNGWENQFEKRIAKIRENEIRQIKKANSMKALNEAAFYSANIVIPIVIFLVQLALGDQLNPRTVFTTISLINVVQVEMTKHLSLAVMGGSECYVSIKRIQAFLEHDELDTSRSIIEKDALSKDESSINQQQPLLSFSNVTCHWSNVEDVDGLDAKGDGGHRVEALMSSSQSSSNIAIKDTSFTLKKGELTCIIGNVGSGKSAVLQAIAGELTSTRGEITRNYSSLSYAAQDSWIMNGTVRENILMGTAFDETWYAEVVNACGLDVDFQQFRDGDATIVGDRGVQCSGGQRARIGLARALYRDADVMLLDDPLSAVDTKVGKNIFYSAIDGLGVKRGKCVVLVTHQHQFIGESRCILVVDGRIGHDGTYADCISSAGGAIKMLTHTHNENASESAQDGDTENTQIYKESIDETDNKPHGSERFVKGTENEQSETIVTGDVRLQTFLNYSRVMGGQWIGVLMLIIFSITQLSVVLSITAMGKWSELEGPDQLESSIIGTVVGLGLSVVGLALFRAYLSFALTVKASRKLHDGMTRAVLRAKIVFFDTNPLGRILNRFSADVGSNDDLLPTTLFDFLMAAFFVGGALLTAMVLLPHSLVSLPPLVIYFLRVRRIFVTTTRELKRVEGTARSPMFSMLSESLNGISTIRANGATDFFQKKFKLAQDAHSRAFFAFISSSRWLGFRMDSLMYVFLTVASFLAVIFNDQKWFTVEPTILGLALTMVIQLGGIFQWCIRQSAEVVNLMVSVERVLAYSNLPPEADLLSDNDKKITLGWPSEGNIDVTNLTVRYRPTLPPSLKSVSFCIKGGQHVGVVGRTGSGKSTLVQALFRILEAEEGGVKVDGIDLNTLGLHKVRTSMSVIPQVPVLFSGCTVRENLDPFFKFDDLCISSALKDVHMYDSIQELPKGLHTLVAENGSNFSVGQRQLLCLARAILRKSRVLVLDEPTANVDSRTDELLQDSIAKSFVGATIISVAHRLDTIIDNDMVLVLGQGKVLEFGTPKELLSQETSHFASMVNDTGLQMAKYLRERANASSTNLKKKPK